MGFILNQNQNEITNHGVYHIDKSSKQVYQFAGKAGTGKSVVLNEIVNRCRIPKHRFAAMAFTGAAAMVMRMKGFPNAKTIHSWLYEPVLVPKTDSSGNNLLDDYLGTPILEIIFIPKDLKDIDGFIIDEGYMVPRHMKQEIESRGKKIVVAGDSTQLKPVADEPAYLYDPNEIEYLTQIMRQKLDSGIIYIADRASLGYPIQTGFYGDCLVIYEDELTPEMIKGADVLLCGKNETKDKYNKMIREQILGINSDIPIYGEKIICRQNDWTIDANGISLANGLSGIVLSPPDISGFNGDTFKLDFKPDLFNASFDNLDIDYRYLIADNKTKNKIKNSKYGSKGQKFDFAYCKTTHLSQGSQHANVIYLEEFLSRDIQNSLNYTGVTRAKNFLIYCKKRRKFY